MTHNSPTAPDDRPPARPHPLAEAEERCAPDDGVSPRPGHEGATRTHPCACAAARPDPDVFHTGAANDALRALLARMRRHRAPDVRAAVDEIAADAAAALLALVERGEQLAPRRGRPAYLPPSDVERVTAHANRITHDMKRLR